MARIKIDIPPAFGFCTNIGIRITDINYGGHVGNDSMLSLAHEARIQFLRFHGFDEMNLDGVGLIMSDAALEFKREIFYGDLLRISVAACEFSKVGFDLVYKMEKQNGAQYILAALAKTGMICYHYELKKIVAVPAGVRAKMQVQY